MTLRHFPRGVARFLIVPVLNLRESDGLLQINGTPSAITHVSDMRSASKRQSVVPTPSLPPRCKNDPLQQLPQHGIRCETKNVFIAVMLTEIKLFRTVHRVPVEKSLNILSIVQDFFNRLGDTFAPLGRAHK
ncbi:MAG: hypothetical protein FWD31_13840 [Planctomycetaceae bacterium]|nr:hypothetical protein [Planctomycetaceae bacterium]